MSVPVQGMNQATNYFEEQKLRMPFVPESQKEKIRMIQPALFSSREEVSAVYDLDTFVKEALSKKVADYVLFGFAGHGVSSRAMHYYAVNEHLAIFVQADYGNAYRNEQQVRDRVNGMLHSAKLFFERMNQATKNSLVAEGRRLLIIDSDFYGKGWSWIHGFPGKIDPETWHSNDLMINALQAIPSIPPAST